ALARRPPRREVAPGEEAALRFAEAIDLVRDEALVEGPAGPRDLLLTRPAAALVQDPPVGRRERGVAEEPARLRRRKVELGRAGPAREKLPVELDRRRDSPHEGISVLGVPDRE